MYGIETINRLGKLAADNAEAKEILAEYAKSDALVSLHCEHPIGCPSYPDRRNTERTE